METDCQTSQNDQPFAWDEEPGESLGRLTMLAAKPVLSRIWDTPEEDEAWKHL